MPHSKSKELVFSLVVGSAGVSLLLWWYHKARMPQAGMSYPKCLSLGSMLDSVTLQEEMHHGPGTVVPFQRRQLQILEKLDELLTSVEELREEVRVLGDTIPRLEEYVQGELTGKAPAHRISPQHRTRRKRPFPAPSIVTSHNSSEEAESEGGCYRKDQSFQSRTSTGQAPLAHLQPETSALSPACQPSVPTQSRISVISSPSFFSTCSSFSLRRRSLFPSIRKSLSSLYQAQSRANFDFREKALGQNTLSDGLNQKSLRHFSIRRVSIVRCYETTLNDLQPMDSRTPSQDTLAPKLSRRRPTLWAPEYHWTYLSNLESKVSCSCCERRACPQSTVPLITLPTIISRSCQQNGVLTSLEGAQLHRHSLFQPQGPSANHLQPCPASAANSSPCTRCSFCSSNCISSENEETTQTLKEENSTPSTQNDSRHLSTEASRARYSTANTDTEEQSFPAEKALNTYIEELDLEALLQKVDSLRKNESEQLESFELLCDHKEKCKDEIEFMWRLTRSYGDMCEMSTNKEEKKHYANIGKTLGEKAISKAPRNGQCHLWYAILCGHVSEYEGLQNKINYGHLFKEHLDKAIELLPEEPLLYYLKGRYCYTVSQLSWIERKMAATLFGKIPSSTTKEALENLLKAEDLSPGFSKSNYMYIAKCYFNLEQRDKTLKFCDLASLLPCVTKADMEAEKEVKRLKASLKGVQ
ncbi:regulator of microtubule dynamics protein 2 isoform X2 [Erinaceus europaeus]|uniref:Regulator of microtubule dynamics protein 2 n=1 Tax=Erinaceus europaeus TaxID=9365 RepID=A0ABM3X233_ERIEU|nr:regulator of microtubule dynamics protein 2 isoform X2 [Erinaceus europaeus]